MSNGVRPEQSPPEKARETFCDVQLFDRLKSKSISLFS